MITRWIVVMVLCGSVTATALGWGSTGHKFVNFNAVPDLPPSMSLLAAQQAFLRDHASDADNRKSADTAEAPKHFIDLESYPDYQHLPRELPALIAMYGWATVKEIGILPWATVWSMDSLTTQFRRGDWTHAYQTCADLGHYVADAHQPLHCTVNYDGALTGNNGIHSRYETGMINQAALVAVRDSARYVADRHAFILAYIIHANAFADSIMKGDVAAKAASGWNGSGQVPAAYYTALWQYCGGFTQRLLQEATVALASLWYTAWVDAGLGVTSVEGVRAPVVFELQQNYPNPFNSISEIRYQISDIRTVKLAVFDLLGREVAVLVDAVEAPGEYRVRWDAGRLPSGVYLYRLEVNGRSLTRKMTLVR